MRREVPVTDAQINAQINILKRDGMYEEQVKAVGEDGLKSMLRMRQAMINVQEKLSPASDSDLKTAYDKMKMNFVHGPRKVVSIIVNPDSSKIDEAASKLKAGGNIDEVGAEYMTPQFGGNGPIKTAIDPDRPGLPKPLADVVKSTKVGGVSKPFALKQPNGTVYCVLEVTKELPKQDIKFAQAKDELVGMIALSKSQGGEFQSLLEDRKKAANIQINVDSLKNVANAFKHPVEAPPMMGGAPRQGPPKK